LTGTARFRPLVFLLDALLGILCAFGIHYVDSKAGLSCRLARVDERVVCVGLKAGSSGVLTPGDTLLTLNGVPLSVVEDAEFLLDMRAVGDSVHLSLVRDNIRRDVTVATTRFYSSVYVVIISIIALLFFLVGIFVYYRRPADYSALIFHFGSVTSAAMMATTSGTYPGEWPLLGPALRIAFYFVYSFVPAIFLHFVTVFPVRRWPVWSWRYRLMYGSAAVLWAGTSATFFFAVDSGSLTDFHRHFWWFTATRWFLLVVAAIGLVTIRQSYVAAREESERRKLRWIMWGLFVGFTPFLFLWILPQIIISRGMVPEEVVMLFTGLIPLAFGFAVVKYHALNIDQIFNRSIVYGSVMAVMLTVYLVVVGVAAGAISTFTSDVSLLVSAGSAIVVAMLFEPMRRSIQGFVDRRYFRVRYDFRKAERDFLDATKGCASVDHLASLMVEKASTLIPVERVGFFTVDQPGNWLTAVSSRGFEVFDQHRVRFQASALRSSLELPVALPDHIEEGVRFETADETVFRKWEIALVFTLLSRDMRVVGFFVLGPKKSGFRFSAEDVDLLRNVTAQAAQAIERIRLQEEVLRKEAEARQLREVNELKSEFVSYVSHELKTPLTSIKMFAQLLQEQAGRHRSRSCEYLGIIEGEADRLNRMVSTILASATIEKGVKEYSFQRIDFPGIVRDVLRGMEYQLAKQKFAVNLDLPRAGARGGEHLWIEADPDAVAEVLINLVSNAIKYSQKVKSLRVVVRRKKGGVECRVEDNGCGIPQEAIPHIFEKFYRAPGAGKKAHGVGLGLSVVKHIIDAHHGRITVHSRPGSGSTFTLFFPSAQTSESSWRSIT
jgi:signal transduction histidine kinase